MSTLKDFVKMFGVEEPFATDSILFKLNAQFSISKELLKNSELQSIAIDIIRKLIMKTKSDIIGQVDLALKELDKVEVKRND